MLPIIKEPNERDLLEIARINSIGYYIMDFYKDLNRDKMYKDKIHYVPKQEGDTKGQYGYYISGGIGILAYIIKALNRNNSFLDLGSGAGVLLWLIQRVHYTTVKGFEIEDLLVESANKLLPGSTIKKDILTITKEDISKYRLLYFYEPFTDPRLSKKFAENLTNIISKDQIILYNSAGNKIGDYLFPRLFDKQQINNIYLFRLKE